ncbi:hypothetical protein, partial [Pectobacterium brasiliense]|uniref:hypothetical protein n=1 Tax=Pectobacterium brasiliense TaxID=180957 RepID=UPI001968A5D2
HGCRESQCRVGNASLAACILSHVVISYPHMGQREFQRAAKINLVIELKPSVSPFTPALTLNGYLEH